MTDEQSLEKKFIAEITDQIFPVRNCSETQKLCFELRFCPDNWQKKNVCIAREMHQILGAFPEQNINPTIAEVVDKLKKQFGEEMTEDGVNWDKRSRGRPADEKQSPWQIAYRWLWERKFPDWQMDWLWETLREKAASPPYWLCFTPESDRGMVGPIGKKPVIDVNVRYYMHIELDCDQEHLLLLNRGLDTKYVVCPSQAFAPVNRLIEKKMIMPQQGAMCEEDKIKFDAVGKEEFLAIVLEESLDLPWLTHNQEELCPEWDSQLFNQLWTSLAESGRNWQVFYRSFDVVG